MGHVVNPNAELSFPSVGNLKPDIEKALDATDKLLTFVDTYGAYIPGVQGYVSMLVELDKFVRGAQKLLEA